MYNIRHLKKSGISNKKNCKEHPKPKKMSDFVKEFFL